MLLYIAQNETSDLIDFIADSLGIVQKKMIGKFSLMQFVIRDMKNFNHYRYLVIDREAVIENDDEFVQAINSFRAIYSARVIVINKDERIIPKLININVTNIITANTIDEFKSQLYECLSDKGMRKDKFKHNVCKKGSGIVNEIRKNERKNWFFSYNMIFSLDISCHAKIIYMFLCWCADSDAKSFPSKSTIAENCSISVSSVKIALKELMEIGLL